jgi:cobalt-zinc-cadmium efflux system outer membrane protein
VAADAPSADVRALLRDNAALVTWVRAKSPEVAASSARVMQAQADVGTSRLVPNPIVDFSVGDIVLGPTNPRGLTYGETSIYSVGLTETIELGKRGPRRDAAELRLASAKRSAASTLEERVAVTRRALARLVYLKAKQDVLSQELASVEKVTELEKVRLDQGAISGNDFDRLTLDKTSLEIDIARTAADFAGALANCREVLRVPCDVGASTADDLDAAAGVPPGLAGTDMLEHRADIEALRLERDAAEKDATLASRRAIPDPAVRLGFIHDNLVISGDQENTVSLGVVVPLPIFDRGQYDASKARARAMELEHTRDAALNSASADLEDLRGRTALLARALGSLSKDALPKSQSIVGTTAKAFDRGQVSMTELLLARRTHITLLLNVLDLKFDFFGARNELRRVLGLDTAQAEEAR